MSDFWRRETWVGVRSGDVGRVGAGEVQVLWCVVALILECRFFMKWLTAVCTLWKLVHFVPKMSLFCDVPCAYPDYYSTRCKETLRDFLFVKLS